MIKRTCSIEGCGTKHYGRGYCEKHYLRWMEYHDTNTRFGFNSVEERFWAKVDKTGDCWTWTGATSNGGYGVFSFDGKGQSAHRVAYELLTGPIPEGLQIDHLCRVRHCVNPRHLELVSRLENMRRATRARNNDRHTARARSRSDEI